MQTDTGTSECSSGLHVNADAFHSNVKRRRRLAFLGLVGTTTPRAATDLMLALCARSLATGGNRRLQP